MANTQAFRGALQRIQFNETTANAITAQGFRTPEEFAQLSETEIDNMVKHVVKMYPRDAKSKEEQVIFPYRSVQKLKGLRYWVQVRRRLGQLPDSESFTDDQAEEMLTRKQELERIKKSLADAEPKKPKVLNELTKQWPTWWESWDAYMSQLRGEADIPLQYIYRTDKEVSDAVRTASYDSMDERYMATTVLEGDHFKVDNVRVFDELKELTMEGAGWSFIKRFDRSKNGREAVLTLKTQAEGQSAKATRKQRAYAMISSARYSGPRQTFRFADYINIHQRAHNELHLLEEPVAETKKVTDFLNGIRDPKLASVKLNILGNKEQMENFAECQQYLSTVVANVGNMVTAERQLAAVETGGSDGDRKGPYTPDGKLFLGRYSLKQWKELSSETKTRVQEGRKALKDGDSSGGKRAISEVETDKAEKKKKKPKK